ncbi:unnamed protein product [Meloidogyne enterolobii]|uniref:Uncharacterized protein n=1 Tax=Meloidogyne enterolobii TaxID=390850 RepID=A0ACB1AEW7_MELEN
MTSAGFSDGRPVWIPLESNPEAFNKYINGLEVGKVECVEIYGFEDDLLAFVPGPHLALIFCFPYSETSYSSVAKVYSDLIAEGKDKVPEGVFFMKQKIHNACGTFSLLHSLTNNLESIDMGKGSFADWYALAKPLGVQERSDCLFSHTSMAQAHKKCAESGETATPPDTQVEFHFIAYLHYGGRLLEFDSAQNFPRDCGPTTPSNLLSDASKQCKNLMQNLGDIACNALAIVQKKG